MISIHLLYSPPSYNSPEPELYQLFLDPATRELYGAQPIYAAPAWISTGIPLENIKDTLSHLEGTTTKQSLNEITIEPNSDILERIQKMCEETFSSKVACPHTPHSPK